MPMSQDVNVGDLAILQHAGYHSTCNSTLADFVATKQWLASLTPACCRRLAQRLSMARLVAPADGEITFAAARYQLRPLPCSEFEGTWPQDVTRFVFRRVRVPRSAPDIDRPGPLSQGNRGLRV